MTLDSIDLVRRTETAATAMPVPRPEYPRPDRDRSERWLNLNGLWRFEAAGAPDTITVPFAWESEASGVNRTWLERATYRRHIEIPGEWVGSRVVLCFGAVHHHAAVHLDGVLVGEHSGGYEYFEIDITQPLDGRRRAELSVVVDAPADKREIPHGKQRSIPRDDYDGVSFTPTSGIWQTVWLEARGRTYAAEASLRGDSLTGFDARVRLAGDVVAGAMVAFEVLDSGEDAVVAYADDEGNVEARVELTDPRTWSPDHPHLYRVRVTTTAAGHSDTVTVTSGLRRIETRGEELYLNDRRIYLRGVLDQGYWPDSGLTAPSEADLLRDLELAAELGYNLVRKHLKFEEPIWLHEADRRGMLVWAEPACPSRYSPASAAAFARQLEGMVERDGNHPSIIVWGLYNEEWGLDWDIPGSPARASAAVAAYDRLHALDATRPIVDNSGWSHVKTDLLDWHYYEPDLGRWKQAVARLASGVDETFPVRLGPDFVVDKSLYGSDDHPRTGVPIVNSEYGEGFTSLERAWHLRWETQELRRHDRFAGYVYTEFADVEHEGAGLLTADRRKKDWGGCRPADVNAETVLILDLVPRAAGADIEVPTGPFGLDVRISHHGGAAVEGRIRAAWVAAGTPAEQLPDRSDATSSVVRVRPFVVSDAVTLSVPPVNAAARLLLWLEDADGAVRARAFIDAAAVEVPNRRGAREGQFVDAPVPGLRD